MPNKQYMLDFSQGIDERRVNLTSHGSEVCGDDDDNNDNLLYTLKVKAEIMQPSLSRGISSNYRLIYKKSSQQRGIACKTLYKLGDH
jgi:hypothetical protein